MSDRTRAVTLAAAVLVIVVVVGVVLLFGVRPYPDLPSVADQPVPPVSGRLAYTEYGTGGPCVHVVEGDGAERELGCGREYEGEIHWVDDDRLGIRSLSRVDETTIDIIDVTTGDVIDRLDVADGPPPPPDRTNEEGDRVSIGGTRGSPEVQLSRDGDDRETVLQLDGPEDYTFVDAAWTADGRWIAVQDSISRVIVIDAAGQIEPRIWAQDVGHHVVR